MVIFDTKACKPYWLHQSGLAACREGHEEGQRTDEDPQEQPDTYRGQEQSRGGETSFCFLQPKGVDNFVQKWRRHTRMSAWDGLSLPQRHFQRVNLQGPVEGLVTFIGDAGTHVG